MNHILCCSIGAPAYEAGAFENLEETAPHFLALDESMDPVIPYKNGQVYGVDVSVKI